MQTGIPKMNKTVSFPDDLFRGITPNVAEALRKIQEESR